MPTTTQSTTLQESVNIVLSVLGEAPVNSLTGTTSSLALNIIEEVSTDIQSKGWWFNQQTSSAYDSTANVVIYPSNTSNSWHSSIPEEARRYITIRAARIAHARLVGSEENFKFTYQEELVSLAILQQAHVRNAGTSLTFNSYPSELKGLGIDEFIFLSGNVEDKLGNLKLATEIKTQARIEEETDLLEAQALTEGSKQTNLAADSTLKGKQGSLIDTQALTEGAKKTDIEADTTLKGKQGSLIDAQVTTEGVKATDIGADTTLKGKQGSLIDAQAQTEGSKKTDIEADTTLKGKQGSLIDAQAQTEGSKKTDIEADTTLKGKQGSLIDAQAQTEGSKKTDVEADTTLKGKQGSLIDAQTSTEGSRKTDIEADTSLKGKQGNLVDAQELKTDAETAKINIEKEVIEVQKLKTLEETVLTSQQVAKTDAETELLKDTEAKTVAEKDVLVSQKNKLDDERTLTQAEKDYFLFSGVVVNGVARTYKDYRAELRIMGYQEVQFNELPAYKKKEAITDAANLRSSTVAYSLGGQLFNSVNNVQELIGELPVSDCGDNLLATKAKALLKIHGTELQSRGWWFNTETDVEVNPHPTSNHIAWVDSWLNIEIDDVPTTKQKAGLGYYVRNLETKSYQDWSGTKKATIIYKRDLDETPQKYIELLEVRVARLLTELYPQSGIDIQRLPKMEAELNAYFKDRENDQGNYSVFDNYDAAVRVGINRSYNLF